MPPPEKPDAPTRSPAHALEAHYDVEPESRETVVSVFGGASRTGPWAPAEQTRAVAGFGSVLLDFTRADLPAGITDVDAYALFGNVEIRVPATLEVELSGLALLGNVVHRSARTGETRKKLRRWLRLPERAPRETEPQADAEAVLCVRGTAFLGNVVVKVM